MTKYKQKYLRSAVDLKNETDVFLIKGKNYFVHDYLADKTAFIITSEDQSFQIVPISAFCDPEPRLQIIKEGQIYDMPSTN